MKKIGKLTNNEGVVEEIVYVADFEEIANNTGAANQVTIGLIPMGAAVIGAYAKSVENFIGASNITLDVGTSASDPDELIDEWDPDNLTPVYNNGEKFDAGTATVGSGLTQPIELAPLADTPILAEWNGSTGNLTAGKVVVAIQILNLDKFA